MANISYGKSISVRHDVDVFVAGGGPAGVCAAVTAARLGNKVFLAEAAGCLGGLGTAGGVPAFMQFTDGVNFLAGGIGKEIHDKNHALGKVGGGIKAELLKEIYEDMMIEAGVEFTYFTQLIDVIADGRYVNFAVLAAKSGIFAVKAKIFVDGTGDGDLAVMAGAAYKKGGADGKMMAGTLCSVWAGIDWAKANLDRQEANLALAFKDNVFTDEDRHLPGMFKIGDILGGGNLGHAFGVDGTDEASLTSAFVEQRKKLKEYETYYKNYLTGFENMALVSTGALMGIRETRRITGDYELNLEDFKSRAVFEDEIGRYSYPVDIHASSPSEEDNKIFKEEFKTFRYASGESYGIPYRILTPKDLCNVLVAGRCVSSDRYIQGSIRVMPGCFITGQAAGAAASAAISNNTHTRGFDVKALQKKLKDIGAYLPNYAK
ncbi:MAG: FAD-dependent oxidoreductase [Oscillospiraceae bacterium]|nr:FAD-dependent oxidoreductase [Oscillospiraceae bacterium]